jgi:hypothetical protein
MIPKEEKGDLKEGHGNTCSCIIMWELSEFYIFILCLILGDKVGVFLIGYFLLRKGYL